MSKRLLLENEFAALWFHPEARVVHHELRKFIWGDAYRELLNTGLDVLVREAAVKWLSDNRKDSVHSRADSEWLTGIWFPRAARAGWKFWAIVPPENVLGQMNMDRIAAATPHGIEVRMFTDAGAALAWLEVAGTSGTSGTSSSGASGTLRAFGTTP